MADEADHPVLGSRFEVRLRVNGQGVTAVVPAERRLVALLREELGLTGTKLACEVGVCGACTVLVDGRPTSSCITLAVQVDGCDVLTVEGLADHPDLASLQDAFVAEGGLQCGFCTSGQLVAAAALLRNRQEESASPAERAEQLHGNLCRCTGYYGILRAIEAAST